MPTIKESITNERLQYLVLIGISIVVLALTAIGYFSNNLFFQRFMGSINPLIVILLIIFLGIALLSLLLSQDWFTIFKKENLKRIFRWYGLAVLFGLMAILVDLNVVFPADQNVLFPGSLAFYPVMGFIVEILFHILPFSLILIIVTSLSNKINHNKIIWVSIFLVSLLEPILQIQLGYSRLYPAWTYVWTGLHVYLISLSQLIIYKRYDFVSMYSFRIVYYIIWHIIWGYMRLQLLF